MGFCDGKHYSWSRHRDGKFGSRRRLRNQPFPTAQPVLLLRRVFADAAHESVIDAAPVSESVAAIEDSLPECRAVQDDTEALAKQRLGNREEDIECKAASLVVYQAAVKERSLQMVSIDYHCSCCTANGKRQRALACA